MYLNATLTFPLVDADRKGGNAPDGRGGEPNYRLRFTVAFVVLFVVWLIARLNGYWVQ